MKSSFFHINYKAWITVHCKTFHLFKGFSSTELFKNSYFGGLLMSKRIRKIIDPTLPLSKRLPFTLFKMKQWLFFWNCSNRETFFWTPGIYSPDVESEKIKTGT